MDVFRDPGHLLSLVLGHCQFPDVDEVVVKELYFSSLCFGQKWHSVFLGGKSRRSRIFFFLMGDGLLKVQRMGTTPFHSPKVSAHKKLSAVV